MRCTIAILFFSVSLFAFGQSGDDYDEFSELERPLSLNGRQIAGIFKVDAGFEGVILTLNSSGKFNELIYSCDGKQPLDSGHWLLVDQRIILNGVSERRTFDILQFHQYHIFVPQQDKCEFIRQIKVVLKGVKKEELKGLDFTRYIIDKLQLLIYCKKASA